MTVERKKLLYLMLAATIIIWGASFVLVDVAITEGSSPTMIAMARFIVASAIFAGYLVLKKPKGLAKADRRVSLSPAFIGMLFLKGVFVSMAGPTPNYAIQHILSTKSPREAALELKLLTAEEFDKYVRPEDMVGPKKK